MSQRVDWDRHALQTNLLANAVVLVSAGLILLVVGAVVLGRGSRTPPLPADCEWIIVPGHALAAGQPSADFRARLARAHQLAVAAPRARVLLLGGVVPGQTRSEAAAGADWLRERGIAAERLVCEDTSRHTLENFQRACALIGAPQGRLVLVTNRYHLARAATMARNLGLPATLCPAESERLRALARPWRVLWEAYLLHWYHTGRIYARLTGNQGMLARVSRTPRAE